MLVKGDHGVFSLTSIERCTPANLNPCRRAMYWNYGMLIGYASHYNDVIIGTMASQITSLTIVCSIVYSGADQRKHQSSTSLAFVWGIHRGSVNSPHKSHSNAENVSI